MILFNCNERHYKNLYKKKLAHLIFYDKENLPPLLRVCIE